MAHILKDSPECLKSEADLFTLPPTQTTITSGQWVEFHPISSMKDDAPIEFFIPGSGHEYLDLSQTQLYVKAKITQPDDSKLLAGPKVAPVNLFLHSLFSQIDVSLNGRSVTSSSNNYPYRAIIEKLLNYGHDCKTSQLTKEMFYKDTAGKMDVIDPADDHPNEGLKQRSEFFKESAPVEMIGGLHIDLFHQDRLMLNLVDIKLKLIRSKPQFCIMTPDTTNYKVVFDQVSLFVRKVEVNSGVLLGHSRALEHSTAKYPINRVLTKVFAIPSGSMLFLQDNCFSGQMPKRMVIGCVDNDAYNGTYTKSPFDFKNFNLSSIGVYVNGQSVPHQPIECDYKSNQYIRAYNTLFDGSSKPDQGIDISREDYPKGYALYSYDLTPDLCDGGRMNLIKHSNMRLELKFSEPLPRTVSVIVYAEFDSVVEINKTRNVLFDFGN